MTPKEKAKELVEKFDIGEQIPYYSIKHALIAVDECIEATKQLVHHYTKLDEKRYLDIHLSMSLSVQYWQEVKQEIEKL